MAARTEPPSPRRLRDALARGMVPVSQPLVATAALLGAFLALDSTLQRLRTVFQSLFTHALGTAAGGPMPRIPVVSVVTQCLHALYPVLLAALAGAVLATLVQTRGAVTPWGAPARRGPSARARVLSALTDTVRAGVFLTAGTVLAARALTVTSWQVRSPHALAVRALALVHTLGPWLLAVAAGLALVDTAVVHWQHRVALRMTRADADRDRRDDLGAPEVRDALRAAADALDRDDPMTLASVLADTTVLLAGDGVAVALRYVPAESDTPVMVARIHGMAAAYLLADALAARVPVSRSPEALRALTDAHPGRPIPYGAYTVVAAVIRETTPSGLLTVPTPPG